MIRQLGFGLLLLTIAGSMGAGRIGRTHLAQAQSTPESLSTGNLTIEVNALRNQEGNVCLKLFNNNEGFPNNDENALQKTCVPIENSTVADPATDGSASTQATSTEIASTEPTSTEPTAAPAESPPIAEPITESVPITATFRYIFEDLPYGNYAVAIYHDRNSNQRLNRGLFGMPEEGYGFSNDAPANLGPAKFDDAVFPLENTDTIIQIRMRYP